MVVKWKCIHTNDIILSYIFFKSTKKRKPSDDELKSHLHSLIFKSLCGCAATCCHSVWSQKTILKIFGHHQIIRRSFISMQGDNISVCFGWSIWLFQVTICKNISCSSIAWHCYLWLLNRLCTDYRICSLYSIKHDGAAYWKLPDLILII